MVSKPQIRFKGKASGRSGKRSPANGGMSKYIYQRPATQPLDLRWGFENISKRGRSTGATASACVILLQLTPKVECILSQAKGLKHTKKVIRKIRLVAFDFDGVFTDNMVYVFEDGTEAVRCSRGDGIGLQKLKRLGIETVIISTESNPVVSARARKLKIRCVQDCPDKRKTLEDIAQEAGVSLAEVAFVGNDINDLPCLECVALPIVVADAHRDVIPLALYQTKNPGGYGAVREVCDLFEQTLAT